MELVIKLKDSRDKIKSLLMLCNCNLCEFNVNGLVINISYKAYELSMYGYLESMKNKGYVDSLILRRTSKKREITLDGIQQAVCKFYHMSIEELHRPTRKREMVQARQIAQYFGKQETKHSSAVIGRIIGGKDHATVLHSCKIVNNLIETDKKIKQEIEEIKGML